MRITFYGGAGSVTGANYLLESDGFRILIDCGLIQGSNFAEKQNFEPFAYSPASINGVLVTHAHLDHVGRLPKLVSEGYRGRIYSTPPTRDLGELVLLDSEHILGKEAERMNIEPICTLSAVIEARRRWDIRDYHAPFDLGPFRVVFGNAGHVLGSSHITIHAEGKTVVFSGDLGNNPPPIIRGPERMPEADYLLIESTYGDRLHERIGERREDLAQAIRDIISRKGTLLIPAFALERTQEILYHMNDLFESGAIPRIPVFLDSPLAIKMTAVYKKYEDYFNKEASDLVRSGDDILNFPGLHLCLTTEQSKDINKAGNPKIILAGSGMSQGGRILHHELRYLPGVENMILFVGYQSADSLGRFIMEGHSEVRIFGEKVVVRAERRGISAYSAHADQRQLLDWVGERGKNLKQMFIVQGESGASDIFSALAAKTFGCKTSVPSANETVEL